MKLLLAVAVYLIFAFFIGWGILQAVHGNVALLMASVAIYLLLFFRVGCLPRNA